MIMIIKAAQRLEEAGWENDAIIRRIRKMYRACDESYRYPIFGKFSATERAIYMVGKKVRSDGPVGWVEYIEKMEWELSIIVNNAI